MPNFFHTGLPQASVWCGPALGQTSGLWRHFGRTILQSEAVTWRQSQTDALGIHRQVGCRFDNNNTRDIADCLVLGDGRESFESRRPESPGFNFTNILWAAFCAKVFLRNFCLLTVWHCNFLAKEYWRKSRSLNVGEIDCSCLHKMWQTSTRESAASCRCRLRSSRSWSRSTADSWRWRSITWSSFFTFWIPGSGDSHTPYMPFKV